MKHFILKLLVLICILITIGNQKGFAVNDPKRYIERLWKEYNTAKVDSLKISKLFDLAFFYHDYLEDDKLADSISQIAIQIAELNHKPELLFYSYKRYIESNNLYTYYKKALEYATITEQLALSSEDPIAIFNSYMNLISVYISGYAYDKALEYSYKCLSFTAASEDANLKAESYLYIGKSLDGKNQKIEAFRNYLNALSLAEKLDNIPLQIKCNSQLSKFYILNKLYVKAANYKLKQMELIRTRIPIDSVALMWTKQEMQEIDINYNIKKFNDRNFQELLEFALRWKHTRLLNYTIALIRKHLIESDQIGALKDFYLKQFPSLFNDMAIKEPVMYNRLMAYFNEFDNKPDSALYYFNKAEQLLLANPNKILLSNFYFRYGQFLKRHDLKLLAVDKFSKSYENAKAASFFDYMINSSKQLESLYVKSGDYKKAYSYSLINIMLSDSLNKLSKQDQMLALELDHETEQRQLKSDQEKLAKLRRYSIQYTGMIILMIIIFIALLIMGSLKVPIWMIRMLGFFAFIFFFEFIILLLDHKIHDMTHGEPWKILLIKVFLIAILLPLHHFVEKRIISFLISPNMINIFHYPFKSKVRAQIIKMIGKDKSIDN